MPDPGTTDPADLDAQARAEPGFYRRLQQPRRVAPHPGRQQLQKWRNGGNGAVGVSTRSIRRWNGKITRYRKTGNEQQSQVVGLDLLNLALFTVVYPHATLAEMAAYLYNSGGELYSLSTISKSLKVLYTTKPPIEGYGYRAQREDVQFRLKFFFDRPPPLGIKGIPRFKLIDVGGFVITPEKCNRSGGWSLKRLGARKDNHCHHGCKITVLFAIEPGDPRHPPGTRGSVENPRRWVRCIRSKEITPDVFRDFCDYVCTDIETHALPITDDHRVLMWDNSISHLGAYVYETVRRRTGPCRFAIILRPQYHPEIAPVEYKIYDIMENIRSGEELEWDTARLEAAICASAHKIGPFDSSFFRCGCRWVQDANGDVIYEEA